MPDIDRYITDAVIWAATNKYAAHWRVGQAEVRMADALRTALPGILAAYRADVLRGLPIEHECPACGAVTRERMADEQVQA